MINFARSRASRILSGTKDLGIPATPCARRRRLSLFSLLLHTVLLSLVPVARTYTCIGGDGIDANIGGSAINHQQSWLQGYHKGQTAPCSIQKTYTAYEDRDYGDGSRGNLLFGGAAGFSCDAAGHCSGKDQDEPLQLLGTDSAGCCCSAGSIGLGLQVNTYSWSPSDALRYPECDSQLQECQSGTCEVTRPCVPEVCQFEILTTPAKGTIYSMTDDGTIKEIISNCSSNANESNPCIIPPRFNAAQPVTDNLVGADGRFETNKVIFRPWAGDVGECDPLTVAYCQRGLLRNAFIQQLRQELWRYSSFQFRVRSFSWLYGTDDGRYLQFTKTLQESWIEKIEDAYQKMLSYDVTDRFVLQGCPCASTVLAGSTVAYTCDGTLRDCTDGGTKGRLLIVDLPRMRAVDAGWAEVCTCEAGALVAGQERCAGQARGCYTEAELAAWVQEVAEGCGTESEGARCFSQPCVNGCSGKPYPLLRNQTGLSQPSTQWTRIVPYNDRPSVGGAGASLRFDGVDDFVAGPVNVFPQEAFTVMFWIKGLDPARPGQAVMQYISHSRGLQLQVHNTENLEVFLLDSTTGPTGLNLNDLEWHHVALAWSKAATFLADNTHQEAGFMRIYLDCAVELNRADPKASQASAPGGSAVYACQHALSNVTGFAWEGHMSSTQSFDPVGEISFGQRLACNASTRDIWQEYTRTLDLEVNATFCRRKVRHSCDPAFNVTPSPYIPGIFDPEGDCTRTVLGLWLSGGNDTEFWRRTCVRNESDPYTTIRFGPVERQRAIDWMRSNELDYLTSKDASAYTIPRLTQEQLLNKKACTCTSGCFDNRFAFLGHLDEVRVYNFTMTHREIAFRSSSTVRDGINCASVTIDIPGLPSQSRCSHMLDGVYKYGLTLYWPFDDPFSLYATGSSSGGLHSGVLDLATYEVAQVDSNKVGNFNSGLKGAMHLGMGFNSTAPMRVPSTAPVFGAKTDFEYYPRGTHHLVEFKIFDHDTCLNTDDPISTFSDSYRTETCDNIECPDSHCELIRVQLRASASICNPVCLGELFRAQVRDECLHPDSSAICAPSPECEGKLCFTLNANAKLASDNFVNRFYMYTGEWLDEGVDFVEIGRTSKVDCSTPVGGCTVNSFGMASSAPPAQTGTTGSFTGYAVKMEEGDQVEYRNVLCHGEEQCDPRFGFPLPGRVITVDRSFSFVPTSESTYTIFKGKFVPVWVAYYQSDALGGGGFTSDLIKFEVIDTPGEAGTVYSEVVPVSSQQTLLLPAEINQDDPDVVAAYNQPQMQGNIVIAPVNVPLAMDYTLTVPEDLLAVVAIEAVLDEDSHERGFNLTVNGPEPSSGSMFHVLEVHCGLVSPNANCTLLNREQIITTDGKSLEPGLHLTENVTYCDDDTYVVKDSLWSQLTSMHTVFQHGLVQVICTMNVNNTEIYNITAYNYTCLPPCTPTLYTYQILAEGCRANCTSRTGQCDNTFGLYPDEYACVGGEYHGQHCLGINDIGTCFTIGGERARCEPRDQHPGVSGVDLKNQLNRFDPSIMVHAVQFGDIYFVDWLHRGAKVVWNELAVDMAAGLGYTLILKYLIQNGCPWRDSAIEVAKMRGRHEIVKFLNSLRPPVGSPNPGCGCAGFVLHAPPAGGGRCIPLNPLAAAECFYRCGLEPEVDDSCRDGESNYLSDTSTTEQGLATVINGQFLTWTEAPATANCSTGSRRALIPAATIAHLGGDVNYQTRRWPGSKLGFAADEMVCTTETNQESGQTISRCDEGPRIEIGKSFEFLNYHVYDKKLRVLYLPPSGVSGTMGSFNYTLSRMSENPREDLGSPRFGTPIGARWGTVNIFLEPVDDPPVPQLPSAPFEVEEDRITVMTLRTADVDTPQRDIRLFVTDFPNHGDLYQVVSSSRALNRTWDPEFNLSATYFPASMCKTSSPVCTTGNCDEPVSRCFYLNETFVLGERILPYDNTLRQKASSLFNTTTSSLRDVSFRPENAEQASVGVGTCLFTDRSTEPQYGYWAGEVPCELAALDLVPSTCRRCSQVSHDIEELPVGQWSGFLRYPPVYVRRQSQTSILDAPNDPEQGGMCSVEEQCRLGGNTASASSCIDWETLRPDGGPSLSGEPALARVDYFNGTWTEIPFSWRDYTPNISHFPCAGANDTRNCSREIEYKWPGAFQPEGDFPFQERTLTKFGDPVDSDSFYTVCGRQGFYQVMMKYATSVYVTGFDINFDLAEDTFFRVLAKTDRYLPEYTNELHEHLNTTLRDQEDEHANLKVTSFSRTNRMERRYRLTQCGGEEWREIWRGHARQGRQRGDRDATLQGAEAAGQKHQFGIHPTNFTSRQLLLEACGLMYLGPANRAGGNPLQGLEDLQLVGTVGGLPAGFVRGQGNRIAYVPHPNFNGRDEFSFVGIDNPQSCGDIECRNNIPTKDTVHLDVRNVNDQPIASFIEITAQPGQPLEFQLQGVDGSPDSRQRGWQEWGTLGQGAGQASRGGLGPLGMVDGYFSDAPDPLGSPDSEPDSSLKVAITTVPDVGTLSFVNPNSSWVRFVPPAGAGGNPLTEFTFTVTDRQGLTSAPNKVVIHYFCGPGQVIHTESKRCLACPKGYFKPNSDARTSCSGCSAGSAAAADGSSSCSQCVPGTFSSTPSASSCQECPPGTFTDVHGSVRCASCAPGLFAPRSGGTACLECGSLSYSPLPGMARCFDCPALSRAAFLNTSDVADCRCIHGAYQKGLFESNIYQLWSPSGWGLLNQTFVSHDVPRVENPWPPRLNLVGSNCTECPKGGFCHGTDLPPVTKNGYWTDWSDPERRFWPDTVSPQFYRCDSRNVREVCLGYPLFDHQEQNELCKHNLIYGVCDDWPAFTYKKIPDPARCKAGYTGVMCSKCIGHTLKQCVPRQSEADDGWFYYKTFFKTRQTMSYFNMPVVDCYKIGVCDPETDSGDECKAREDTCKANSEWCKWESSRYYRSFDGRCEECPLPIGAGFFIYVAWFAVYGVVVLAIVALSLSDMASFSITFTFWQCAALLPRFQVPWPASAQSLLSIYTVANINLDGLPWKCWLDSAPSFRDIWYLTIFGQAGLVGISIVRWILPFLTVPPQGKALIRLFKTAVARRNDLQGVGSVARVQYTGQAPNAPRSRPVSSNKVASVPTSIQGSRPVSAVSRDAGSRPGSGYDRIRRQSKVSEDLIMEDVAEEDDREIVNAAGFGTSVASSTDQRNLVVIPEEAVSGPRSKASLIPSPVPSPPKHRSEEAQLPGMPSSFAEAQSPTRGSPARVHGTAFGSEDEVQAEGKAGGATLISKAMASIHRRRLLFSTKKAESAANPSSNQDSPAASIAVEPVGDAAAGVMSMREHGSHGSLFAGLPRDPSAPQSLRPSSAKPPRPASSKGSSRPASARPPSRPRSALVTTARGGPDKVFPEELHEASAVSRPMIHRGRPTSALSSSSTKSVSFAGSGSRPGSEGRRPVSPNRAIDLQQIETVRLTTPSRREREAEGYREWSTQNVFQSHTPRMEQRLPTAKGSGFDLVPRMGVAWYVRKQYFDLAWRHAVAMLTILYIMGANKCLEVFKWTMLTSKTGVLDAEPDVLLFGQYHTEVFPFALMIFPVYVCSPAIHAFFLYVGYKLRSLDDPSFSMRWGYLLDPFERKFWFWSMVVSSRKFMFVFANIFLRRSQYMQNFVPALTVCINILLNYHLRPYRVERHNLLENVLLLGLLMFILLGILSPLDIVLYHDANGQDLAGVYENQTILGVMFIQFVTLVSSVVCIYVDIVDAQLTPTPLLKWLYRLLAVPLTIVSLVLTSLLKLLYWFFFLIYKRLRPEDAEMREERARNKDKGKGDKVVNFRTVNRQSGDPPVITGQRYTDILYGMLQTIKGDKGNLAKEAVKEDGELVHPDDGAKWLRDKFAIRKRLFVLERRVQNEALFDPRSVRILRVERQLTVALDAALAQAKRERDALFDQLYDAQTEFEAISADHKVAKDVLKKEEDKCDQIMDRTMLLQAKLDATIRRAGQPENWKSLFLEQEAKRMALAQEIVDLQAQAYEIQLAKEQEDDEEAGMDY